MGQDTNLTDEEPTNDPSGVCQWSPWHKIPPDKNKLKKKKQQGNKQTTEISAPFR